MFVLAWRHPEDSHDEDGEDGQAQGGDGQAEAPACSVPHLMLSHHFVLYLAREVQKRQEVHHSCKEQGEAVGPTARKTLNWGPT